MPHARLNALSLTRIMGFDQAAQERLPCARTTDAARVMIRNGLCHITVEMLDGVQGGNQGVMEVRDGTLARGRLVLLCLRRLHVGKRQMEGRTDGIALAGTQSIRFKSKLRLLIPD